MSVPAERPLELGFVAKVKHGDLLKAIRARGWSQAEAARFLGVSQCDFGQWINLKTIPGELSLEIQRKLMELTHKTPEELFPKWIKSKEFQETNPRQFEFYRPITHQALADARAGDIPTLEDLTEEHERKVLLNKAIASLDPRSAEIVRMRMQDYGWREIAENEGISVERVHQIYDRAAERITALVRPEQWQPPTEYKTSAQWLAEAREARRREAATRARQFSYNPKRKVPPPWLDWLDDDDDVIEVPTPPPQQLPIVAKADPKIHWRRMDGSIDESKEPLTFEQFIEMVKATSQHETPEQLEATLKHLRAMYVYRPENLYIIERVPDAE